MTPHPATPGGTATAGPIDVGPWRTSSYTGNGQSCVEVAPWRTSSYTENREHCVEVAPSATGVLLRDTKDHGTGPVLSFTTVQWARFLQETRTGDTGGNGAVEVTHSTSGTAVRDVSGVPTLHFTPGEWTAFCNGVLDREFDILTA